MRSRHDGQGRAVTLKQVSFLREIVRCGMNISAAAIELSTSQPGISRQIQLLERELGVPVLIRRHNRIVGLTEIGAAVADAGSQLLEQADKIRQIAAEAKGGSGRLIVATSHLHARYTLLKPFKQLRTAYPNVELLLLQSEPDRIIQLVQSGDADIGVSTGRQADAAGMPPGVAIIVGKVLRRSLIVPKDHTLTRLKRPSLAEIAEHPLIGYGPNSQTGLHMTQAFSALGLSPRYVVRASDSGIIQAFVAENLGVGIIPTAAVASRTKSDLVAIDITGLLPVARTVISLRREVYLRRHLVEFIRMIEPAWDRVRIQRQLDGVSSRSVPRTGSGSKCR